MAAPETQWADKKMADSNDSSHKVTSPQGAVDLAAEAGLAAEHLFRARIEGESMVPTLLPGTMILVERLGEAGFGGLRIGDIIVIRTKSARSTESANQPEGLVAHRLRALNAKGELILQGDGMAFPDAGTFRPDALEGRVVAVLQGEGAGEMVRSVPRRVIARMLAATMRIPGGRLGGSAGLRIRRILGRLAWRRAAHLATSEGELVRPASGPIFEVSAASDKAKQSEIEEEKQIRPLSELRMRFEDQQIGDEWALHDRKTGAVHMLNSSAGLIWRLLRDGANETEVIRAYQAEFHEVSAEEAHKDVNETRKMLGLDTN